MGSIQIPRNLGNEAHAPTVCTRPFFPPTQKRPGNEANNIHAVPSDVVAERVNGRGAPSTG